MKIQTTSNDASTRAFFVEHFRDELLLTTDVSARLKTIASFKREKNSRNNEAKQQRAELL